MDRDFSYCSRFFSDGGFLAGSYVGAHTTSVSELSEQELDDLDPRSARQARRGAVRAFLGNAIEQLPNIGTVISWHFANRIWLPILIAFALAGVVGGGVALKKVEQTLTQPRRR